MKDDTIPERPSRVTLALYLLYISLGIGVITALVTWLWFGVPDWFGHKFLTFLVRVTLFRFQAPIWVVIYGSLIILPVAFWLYYMIGKGTNWARIILLTYVILETFFCVWSVHFGLAISGFRHVSLLDFLIRISPAILQDVLQIIAAAFLFGRISSDWFKAMKVRNQLATTTA